MKKTIRKITAMICTISLLGMLPFNTLATGAEKASETPEPTKAAAPVIEQTTVDWNSMEYPTQVIIWGKDIELSPEQEIELTDKVDQYRDSVDETKYTYTEYEKMMLDYYRDTRREMIKAMVAEQNAAIVSEIGLDMEKASFSGTTSVIIAEVTKEQVDAANKSDLVVGVTPFEPITEWQEAVTNDPYTEEFLKSLAPGDANMDYVVTLADALLILQYIANSEKYPLEGQALINADCYDPGYGITPLDALAIQKYDAKMLIYLPEYSKTWVPVEN